LPVVNLGDFQALVFEEPPHTGPVALLGIRRQRRPDLIGDSLLVCEARPALRITPVHDDMLVEADGRLVIPASGSSIDDELVQTLRDADRR
jgi:hypothetical protein